MTLSRNGLQGATYIFVRPPETRSIINQEKLLPLLFTAHIETA